MLVPMIEAIVFAVAASGLIIWLFSRGHGG
jgi:hypothetical protein